MSGTGGVVPGPPDHPGHNRHMKPPQPGPAQGGVAGVAGGQVRREPPPGVQHQPEHQEFDSWRHQTHQPQQGYNHLNSMASDPYLSSFYAGSYHYPGFGVGDGTWSNGGDHMTFLGSYGGGIPAGTEGGVPQPYGTDLSQATMFGAGAAGGFGAFTQPGYGFDFHNPAAAAAGAGYSQWGRGHGQAPGGEYYPRDPYAGPHPAHGPDQVDRQGRLAAAEQAMQGLSIAAQQMEKEPLNGVPVKTERSHEKVERQSHEANGGSGAPTQGGGGHSKKMSWANIASQPAKPPPPPSKTKKPGVLPPPVVVGAVPGKHNMDIGMWDGASQNGVPPPVITGPPPPVTGPPPVNGSVPPGGRGPPIMAGVALAGPRGVKGPGVPQPFGVPPHVNGPPPSPPSHPVLDELQSVNNYNPRDFEMNPKNARFFVLKSYSEDDIHRSIKYEIWCSTEHGNKRLDSAFRERDSRGPVFLFFSVNGSGHFCGMAEMLSCLDYNSSAGVWAQDKWKGKFQVRWIYVKDVPNSQLRHIRLENNENKPVTNSRDTQEVPPEKGKMVLKIIHNYKHATSIFDDFIHYEKRQEEDEVRKPTPKNPSHDRGGREDRRAHDGREGGRDDRDDRRRDDRRDDRRDNRDHRNRDREHGGGGVRGDHHRGGGDHHRQHRGENGERNGDRNSDRDSVPRETGGGGRGGDRGDRGGHGHGARGRGGGGGGGGRGEQSKQ